MRKFVVGDIHSGLIALRQVIQRAKVKEEDLIIFLGDYVDGWSEAVETIDYLISLNKTHQCIFIRGNHDELCREWLERKAHNPNWLIHGGKATKLSYEKVDQSKRQLHLAFYRSLQNYYLDEGNRLFLHAGYTNLKGIAFEYFQELFYWDRTLWELAKAINPRLNPEDVDYPKRLTHYNEIFIGHTPISKKEMVIPENRANVWNLDTGAAFKGALTIMDVDTKEFWQSDPVHQLYLGEQGRN